MTTSVENNSIFKSFFEKQKLTGPNFIDWYRQLRLVLSTEDKENYLEHPIPATPVAPPGHQVPPQAIAAHAAWVKGQKEVDVLMLLTMDLEIQRNLAHLGAYDMLQELKAMYFEQAKQELLQTVREFHTCKQEKGQSVSSHVLKMKGYIDNLERLGQPVGKNFAVSLILVSLNKDFDSFVQNYNIHSMGKTVNELHAMLKLYKESLPKTDDNPALHAIRAGRVQKNQKNKPHKAAKGGHGKGKGKMGNASFASKPKTPPPPKKDNPAKDAIFHQCGKVGHWRRNCPGLRGSKKLKPGALSLYVGDGHRAAVEAIETYHLELPSGLVIILNNCHYAPSITRDLKVSGSVEDLELIQKEDTNPSVDTSLNHEEDDQEIDEPQSDINPIRKSSRTRRAPDRMCLYIDAEEHELGDLGEPANYKVALLDAESKKWLDAMNVEMQSMKDNDVWILVELPPNARTVGSKWLFKKKTDMDGAVYIFKARLNMTSRFQQNPGEEHWTAVKNILKYLHNTKDIFLVYGGNIERELRVSCYTDAGYLTDADNLKSQTGYVFVLNGGVVDWKKPISMYCDNTGAIEIAKDDGVTKGARHFRAKVHYLRETIKLGDVKIEKIDTDDNLADPFTKALAFPKHSELTRNIGLLPASSFMSSYARVMIVPLADVELKDTIMVAMPKLIGEGFYICIIRVEYEWKPPSNPNSFDVLNVVENDVDLGTNGKTSNLASKKANSGGSLSWNDKPMKKINRSGDHDSDDELEPDDNEMTSFLASKKDGCVKDGMIDCVLHKYGSNWQVHDARADDIRDDLLKREWEKQKRVKYDKKKVTQMKIQDLLEKRIEKAGQQLNKEKQIIHINKGKEKMIDVGQALEMRQSQNQKKPKSRSKHLAPTTPRTGSTCTTVVVQTKRPPPLTNSVLGLAVVTTWQQILNKKFGMKRSKEKVGGSSNV
uniref:Zinc finger, CCHC-type n=1 Tax=Tanacetum cinerariifolium TaxID=118510 RepID=A0A6L2NAH4_TANCI|nr:zinc finger, CCHC-type [Tanacetum cinerariifolium]